MGKKLNYCTPVKEASKVLCPILRRRETVPKDQVTECDERLAFDKSEVHVHAGYPTPCIDLGNWQNDRVFVANVSQLSHRALSHRIYSKTFCCVAQFCHILYGVSRARIAGYASFFAREIFSGSIYESRKVMSITVSLHVKLLYTC